MQGTNMSGLLVGPCGVHSPPVTSQSADTAHIGPQGRSRQAHTQDVPPNNWPVLLEKSRSGRS